jgi:CheY-like chemotaxis protein
MGAPPPPTRVIPVMTAAVRILVASSVVEDAAMVAELLRNDEFQHKLLRQLLAAAELELAFATSAIEALAALRRSRPDLILMDVNLPDIDGVEATRRIKSVEQFASIPVIMISGDSEKDKVVDCLKAGASAFVVKPLDKTTLLAKLRKFLH